MTSNVKRYVQLPRSSQKGKKPTADDLKYGEIAVNFNNEDPFLAIKGSDDSIITMGFKENQAGPWKKGEGEYSAVLDNGAPTSPSDKVNTATKMYATAEGKGTTASGEYSHAEGNSTTASGRSSHAEGDGTTASGNNSHAEGFNTTASGDTSHAEGQLTNAIGNHSHAEGNKTIAMGDISHAEGKDTNAAGAYSHAEGIGSIALGTVTHVEGLHSKAMNFTDDVTIGATEMFIVVTSDYSTDLEYYKNCIINGGGKSIDVLSAEFAPNAKFPDKQRIKLTLKEGTSKASTRATQTTENQHDGYFYTWNFTFINKGALGDYSGHAEGKYTMVYSTAGHAEGHTTISKGEASHAEGYRTMASGYYSHSEGKSTTASGLASHTEGENTVASETYAHAEGFNTTANGSISHAEGNYTTASGQNAHAEGSDTTASGKNSHAEGDSTTASNERAHAEGNRTTAKGSASHAEGGGTIAEGVFSHAEGNQTIAKGINSHAEGLTTKANGDNSHAGGSYTIAENDSEFACGTYNKFNVNQLFSIGIGTDNNRKNAISVTQDGVISSDVTLTNGATSMTGLKISGGVESTKGMIAPTYLNSSDERLKKDIETISENDIDKVKNVDFKSYKFKFDDSRHYGIIAQDVEKAGLTELVTNGADGMKSVDYISLLILKIAELENELKSLKEQIKK